MRQPRVGPHTLRHAFITAALDADITLRDVQEVARHADPRTTMRYKRARVLSTPRPTSSTHSSPALRDNTPDPARITRQSEPVCVKGQCFGQRGCRGRFVPWRGGVSWS